LQRKQHAHDGQRPRKKGNALPKHRYEDLKPETAAELEALASASGLSVEGYLEQLVEKELPLKLEDATRSEGSGMVWENGLFCLPYRQAASIARNR
jgi:hypothetical protein